jgi:hypothetical protein
VATSYSKFKPDSRVVLFYTLVHPSGHEVRIMEKTFTISSSGSGVFETTWTVPWDDYLVTDRTNSAEQGVFINVKSSSSLGNVASTGRFRLSRQGRSLLASPRPDSVQRDVIHAQWDPSLLSYFVPTDSLRGKNVVSEEVTFQLLCVKELGQSAQGRLDKKKEGEEAWEVERHLLRPEASDGHSAPNTGNALLRIPDHLKDQSHCQRFSLRVSSAAFSNVGGMSDGTFTLAPRPSQASVARAPALFV